MTIGNHADSKNVGKYAGTASTKFLGGQIFWLEASNSILFGTPPFKPQNDKVCQNFVGNGPLAHPVLAY